MSDENKKTIVRIEDEQFTPIGTGIENAGNWEVKKARLVRDAYQEKGKSFVVLKFPFRPGDHFVVDHNKHIKYYIASKYKLHPYGGVIFEVKRVDGYPISQFDLDILKKGGWAQVKGYFNDKQCPIK